MNAQEWNRLVAGWMEGTLEEADQRLLRDACMEDPAREEELAKASLADRLLPLVLTPEMDEATIRRILELSAQDPENIPPEVVRMAAPEVPVKQRVITRFRTSAVLSAVAALTLVAGAWFLTMMWRPVGYLSRSESLVWESAAPGKDGSLLRGQHLRASSGLAEFEMGNGARIVLEAPFDVMLTGRMSLDLVSGRLAARCPASARGFAIVTPRGTVTDLGTELAVHVGGDGAVEAHVLTGSAEISGESGQRKYALFDGEAVRMDTVGARRLAADASAFVTSMPLADDVSTGYVHWNMDEGAGDRAADSGHDLAEGADSSLFLGKDEDGRNGAAPPRWTKGVRGSGLAFDGIGSYAESTYRGIEGALPRTVALWVKTPVDGDEHAGTGILSWGSVMQDSAWQISMNWSPVDGAVGRLRLGTFAGRIVGTTDLRDGQWHHIAVVMYPPSHPEAAVNVLLYVDGKLEPISLRSNFRVNTNTRLAEHGVSLGRHVSLINKTQKFFRGEMDDVFILGRPLMQEQIRKLMKGDAEYMPRQ